MKTSEAQSLPEKKEMFSWDSLPSIPDPVGFAGSFAGVANEVLIVAGGSNFPNGGTPWNGGTKTWYDNIFVLENPGAAWKKTGKLPFPLGYGVSVSTPQGLMIIGGSNAAGHYSDVILIHYRNGKIGTEKLPSMPFALANSCGALVGNKIYVAGGIINPSSPSTEKLFLSFDLESKRWMQLPTWPGPSRMLSVAGSDGAGFYLFSGTQLTDGKRSYLQDAYSFTEDKGWQKLADLPFPVVAAPSPAFCDNEKKLFLFGGDTGKDAAQAAFLREKHPGFSDSILEYNSDKNEWSAAGRIYTNSATWSPVTTSLVVWENRVVLPGGEVRPGVRTPRVLTATKK
ncbi:galactose oxidase [Flavihumibacter solisilvae]|uniref:galactose oxidase n=1 Tax=Flavihumibacter solisilvae TaxID=1349421 RepID=UPI001F0803F1|nr:galactose oxidase [Flavihumibacter solisilvae]